jgi:hypothetical protein
MAAAPKTRPTDADVTAFLDAVPAARRREEGHAMRALFERVTGEPAVMWGPTMVGFGSEAVVTTSGTNDWFVVGFSPRASALTLYGVTDDEALLSELGPHTTGASCLYLKRLDAVDADILERLVRTAWQRATSAG